MLQISEKGIFAWGPRRSFQSKIHYDRFCSHMQSDAGGLHSGVRVQLLLLQKQEAWSEASELQ